MRETLPDVVVEAGTLLFDLFVAVVLTLAGIGAELQSAQTFGSDTLMAAWLGYMGLIALYAGLVVFGQGRLLGRLQHN
ncbi:hypothetical protein [Halorarius litoreus]|uniref:hypothetical protein n=1 Tax=Halorarius litoreus TaxID=2962676 RepID=UPI0020CC5C81|nr:hypothetical protein [Halorarius litoreus]